MLCKRAIAVAISVSLAVAGCATSSAKISAAYVSPNQYSTYDCAQLAAEGTRIQTRVVQLGGRLDEAAKNDAGIMAVGLILFWPVLFALGGTKEQEAEYARLKGEYDAVQQAAIAKRCAPAPNVTTATVTAPVQPDAIPAPSAPPTAMAPAPVVYQPPVVVPVSQTASQGRVQAVSIGGESKYMFSAEQYAKANGCAMPVASMVVRQSLNETFSIECHNGDTVMVKCEAGACRAMK